MWDCTRELLIYAFVIFYFIRNVKSILWKNNFVMNFFNSIINLFIYLWIYNKKINSYIREKKFQIQ